MGQASAVAGGLLGAGRKLDLRLVDRFLGSAVDADAAVGGAKPVFLAVPHPLPASIIRSLALSAGN